MKEQNLKKRIHLHIERIYSTSLNETEILEFSDNIYNLIVSKKTLHASSLLSDQWSEKTTVLITYANSITSTNNMSPLSSLQKFVSSKCQQFIDTVHILPFFPSSSDDGFAVKDYYNIDNEFGDWKDIINISKSFRVMADVVINHGSSEGVWFKNFIKGEGRGHDYFLSFDNTFDITEVVRPRTSPLLNTFDTHDGTRYLWCTFSKDQVDYNFNNPKVINEFVEIILYYLKMGITIFRFDAVAFLWKRIGTSCMNLEKTHEIIRLFRTIIDYLSPYTVLVTETNTPAAENVSYFGNGNEAHWIYNFSLPPILIYSVLIGNASYLEKLTMSMPPSQIGTSYLNFIASHDGIGLRPVETFLTKIEVERFTQLMENNGGKITYRSTNTDVDEPYEINISLFDAMKETFSKEKKLFIERYICIHTIMMSLEGVPAFYIHSLFGTENDYALYQKTGHNRSLNRGKIDYNKMNTEGTNTKESKIYNKLKELLLIRRNQAAFHPNALQFTLHLGNELYGIWRQSIDKTQSIFCVTNITEEIVTLSLLDINLDDADKWHDLITQKAVEDNISNIELKPYQTVWLSNK
mgnify:FL=1